MKEQLIKLHFNSRKNLELVLKYHSQNIVGPREQLEVSVRKLTVRQMIDYLKSKNEREITKLN